jgi:hypothetical protein
MTTHIAYCNNHQSVIYVFVYLLCRIFLSVTVVVCVLIVTGHHHNLTSLYFVVGVQFFIPRHATA